MTATAPANPGIDLVPVPAEALVTIAQLFAAEVDYMTRCRQDPATNSRVRQQHRAAAEAYATSLVGLIDACDQIGYAVVLPVSVRLIRNMAEAGQLRRLREVGQS